MHHRNRLRIRLALLAAGSVVVGATSAAAKTSIRNATPSGPQAIDAGRQ